MPGGFFGKEGGGQAAPLLPLDISPSPPLRRDFRSGDAWRRGAAYLDALVGVRPG